jgi:hypothetical protein
MHSTAQHSGEERSSNREGRGEGGGSMSSSSNSRREGGEEERYLCDGEYRSKAPVVRVISPSFGSERESKVLSSRRERSSKSFGEIVRNKGREVFWRHDLLHSEETLPQTERKGTGRDRSG